MATPTPEGASLLVTPEPSDADMLKMLERQERIDLQKEIERLRLEHSDCAFGFSQGCDEQPHKMFHTTSSPKSSSIFSVTNVVSLVTDGRVELNDVKQRLITLQCINVRTGTSEFCNGKLIRRHRSYYMDGQYGCTGYFNGEACRCKISAHTMNAVKHA